MPVGIWVGFGQQWENYDEHEPLSKAEKIWFL